MNKQNGTHAVLQVVLGAFGALSFSLALSASGVAWAQPTTPPPARRALHPAIQAADVPPPAGTGSQPAPVPNRAQPSVSVTTEGATVVVAYEGFTASGSDWIAIYPEGADAQHYGSTQYVPASTRGELRFESVSPGRYLVRGFFDWSNTSSYVVRAESQVFEVQAGSTGRRDVEGEHRRGGRAWRREVREDRESHGARIGELVDHMGAHREALFERARRGTVRVVVNDGERIASGFVLHGGEYIVASSSTIPAGVRVKVEFVDRGAVFASPVARDSRTDVVLLKLEAAVEPERSFLPCEGEPRRGEHAFVVGQMLPVLEQVRTRWAHTLEWSVTRAGVAGFSPQWISSDVALSHGQAGSPLLALRPRDADQDDAALEDRRSPQHPRPRFCVLGVGSERAMSGEASLFSRIQNATALVAQSHPESERWVDANVRLQAFATLRRNGMDYGLELALDVTFWRHLVLAIGINGSLGGIDSTSLPTGFFDGKFMSRGGSGTLGLAIDLFRTPHGALTLVPFGGINVAHEQLSGSFANVTCDAAMSCAARFSDNLISQAWHARPVAGLHVRTPMGLVLSYQALFEVNAIDQTQHRLLLGASF